MNIAHRNTEQDMIMHLENTLSAATKKLRKEMIATKKRIEQNEKILTQTIKWTPMSRQNLT